jgi:outer membrane lipoprotein-sorting protein
MSRMRTPGALAGVVGRPLRCVATAGFLALTTVIAPALPSATPAAAAIDPAASEALVKINDYFNGVRTMKGDFVQFGPYGDRSEGTFIIARPGRILFRYDPPQKLDVVADGSAVVVRDKRRATQDVWPLSKTPLRFLLADKIDLTRDAKIANVALDGDLVTVTIQESTVFGEGKLDLVFDAKSSELRQWTVTDGQGQQTTVAIYNVETGVPADPALFKVDYTPLAGPKQ